MPILAKLTKDQYEKLPDFLQDGYEQNSDGTYKLKEVEGMIDKKKLDEFRENNRTLQTQIEEVQTQLAVFEGVDVDKFKELQEQQRQLEEKELIEAGDIDKIVEARIKPVVEAKDKEIKALAEQNSTANTQLSVLMIDDVTADLATAVGVESTALMDVKSRARSQFKIKDGKAVAVDGEGNAVYGEDGVTPLALDKSWMENLKTNAPHLFKPAKGTGADNENGTRTPGGVDTSRMSSVQKISHALNEQEGAA